MIQNLLSFSGMGLELIVTIIGNEVMGLMLSFSNAEGKLDCSRNDTTINVTVHVTDPPKTIELQVRHYKK